MTTHQPGTVLLAPDANPRDPDACRIIARSTTHGDWPYTRLTGAVNAVPSRWADLSGWRLQTMAEVGAVLGA